MVLVDSNVSCFQDDDVKKNYYYYEFDTKIVNNFIVLLICDAG